MRKYVLTDADGVSPQGVKLEPGKLVQDSRQKYEMMNRLVGCGSDTPLLATLISPLPSQNARLFQINCWTVSTDPRQPSSYTVVKEVRPVPAATLEHKFAFGLLVLKALGADRDFKQWADDWLSGADRSVERAKKLLVAEEEEKRAAGELEALAAWGQTGTDDEIAQDKDELAERCANLVQAAALHADPSKHGDAALLLSKALGDLAKQSGKISLDALAEQAMSSVAGSSAGAAAR